MVKLHKLAIDSKLTLNYFQAECSGTVVGFRTQLGHRDFTFESLVAVRFCKEGKARNLRFWGSRASSQLRAALRWLSASHSSPSSPSSSRSTTGSSAAISTSGQSRSAFPHNRHKENRRSHSVSLSSKGKVKSAADCVKT